MDRQGKDKIYSKDLALLWWHDEETELHGLVICHNDQGLFNIYQESVQDTHMYLII